MCVVWCRSVGRSVPLTPVSKSDATFHRKVVGSSPTSAETRPTNAHARSRGKGGSVNLARVGFPRTQKRGGFCPDPPSRPLGKRGRGLIRWKPPPFPKDAWGPLFSPCLRVQVQEPGLGKRMPKTKEEKVRGESITTATATNERRREEEKDRNRAKARSPTRVCFLLNPLTLFTKCSAL